MVASRPGKRGSYSRFSLHEAAPFASLNVHQDVDGTNLIAKCDQDYKESSRQVAATALYVERRARSVSHSTALSVTVCRS